MVGMVDRIGLPGGPKVSVFAVRVAGAVCWGDRREVRGL